MILNLITGEYCARAFKKMIRHCEKRSDEATFASLTPPLALLASLSCFTLRLKPRKTGNPANSSAREHS
jgi:hypothetical protein